MITVDFELTKTEADIVYDAIRLHALYSNVIDDVESQITFEQSMIELYEPLQQVKHNKASSIQLNEYTSKHILYSLQNLRYVGGTLHHIIDETKFNEMCEPIKKLIHRLMRILYMDTIFEVKLYDQTDAQLGDESL